MLERVAHFTILAKLGQGGMGVVFKAQDTKLRRLVALKLLPPEHVSDPERRARFMREARSAASVNHPNIAAIYEVGEDDDGRVFIAMELASGRSLREALPLDVAETVAIARQITRGLAKAHDIGLVHRDLKPDNLMLGPEGEVKILDFGLAKMRELSTQSVLASAVTGELDGSHVTAAGVILGTPGYMSPEQATGNAVDARSDIFSLGVILFEMLTGKLPFRASTVGELIVAAVRDEPRSMKELAPEVPRALEELIVRCLAKSPADRPQDAREVYDALDNALSGDAFARTERAVTDPPPAPSRPAVAPARKKAGRNALVAVAVLALAFGAVFLAKRMERIETVSSRDASTPDAAARIGLLDLPPPLHCNEAARVEYRAALEVSRGRGLEFGQDTFQHALKADPQCAEVLLRAAIYTQWGSSAHEYYNRAALLRDRLSEPDRELLDAFAPYFTQEPPDYAGSHQRILALSKKRPRDSEVLILTGFAMWGYDPNGEMAEYGQRVIDIDPGFSAGWQLLGVARMKANDNEGARQAFEQCDRTIPTAVDCVEEEARLAQAMGRCVAMESHARTLATRLPGGTKDSYMLLARALAANDDGREAVAEALRQYTSSLGPEKASLVKVEGARLALAYGDFDRALTSLAEAEQSLDGSENLARHASFTQLAFDLNLEIGRPEVALKIAQLFAGRQRAWSGSVAEFYGSGEEGFLTIPRMLGLQLKAGAITPERRDAELSAWIAKSDTLGDPRVRWLAHYAASAQTPADAEHAVAVMPHPDASFKGLQPLSGLPSALVGRVLALGGRQAEGIAELRRFTRRCERLDTPIAQTRAYLWLGEALEATGEASEACAEYAVVVARWGDAHPPSVSAKRAAERIKTLGCSARDR